MPNSEAKTPKAPYLRVRDLDGQLWTIPPGSALWQQLYEQQLQGYPVQFIPADVLRAGAIDRETTMILRTEFLQELAEYTEPGAAGNVDASESDEGTRDGATELWRTGQWLRICDRIERRAAHGHGSVGQPAA